MSNLSAFAYHSPEDNAREAAEHELFARQDYLREAFGGEADLCDDVDADYYDGLAAADLGLTLEAYRADRAAKLEALYEARRAEQEARDLANDEIPF